jgi:hypothetical protein
LVELLSDEVGVEASAVHEFVVVTPARRKLGSGYSIVGENRR